MVSHFYKAHAARCLLNLRVRRARRHNSLGQNVAQILGRTEPQDSLLRLAPRVPSARGISGAMDGRAVRQGWHTVVTPVLGTEGGVCRVDTRPGSEGTPLP